MQNYGKLFKKFVRATSLQTLERLTPLNHNVFMQREVFTYSAQYNLRQNGSIRSKKNPRINVISNFDDLLNYVRNNGRINTKYLSEVLTNMKCDNLTEENVIFLLECCGKIIPGETFNTKHALCQEILQKFKTKMNYSLNVYKSYITVCTENKQIVDVEGLMSSLGSKIDLDTMKLLLKNVCERGETDKALTIIVQLKKKEYPADEHIFSDLILSHTIKGGLTSGQSVLQTMLKAKLKENDNTKFSLIKGLAQRNDKKLFIETLEKYPVIYTDSMVLSLLDSLGFAENHGWIKHIKKKLNIDSFSREFMAQLDKLCMNLIHNHKYDSAFEIYKQFVEPKVDIRYGGNILREMLICSAPIDKIVDIAKDLKNSGLNEFALEDVTDLALKYKLMISAMRLFQYFDILRPHFFWPIMMKAKANQGEHGIMEVVQKAHEMNVTFDSNSFQEFIFPHCDLNDPKRVIEKFQKYGYSVKSLLTPMLVVLLRRKETQLALETCYAYDVQIGSLDLINNLPYTWIGTVHHDVCLTLIQKMSESMDKLLLGTFLHEIISLLHSPGRLKHFLHLLKEAKRRKLTIDTTTSEAILNILRKSFAVYDNLSQVEEALMDLLDMTHTSPFSLVPRPNEMDIDQLECHLIELKSKDMETRGVIRKLIQKHTREGNLDRVKELDEELSSNHYDMSPGMKASVMHSHIRTGNLSGALKLYGDIKKTPNFKLDVFKLIDLATLLVKSGKFNVAVDILLEEAKARKLEPGNYLERNCKELLSSVRNVNEQKTMFDILLDNGYCDAYNIVLGSLVQLHLEKESLEKTVDLFVQLSHKYRKTPMQIVLLSATLEYGNQELLQKMLNTISSVHGSVAAHCALLSALCEKGYKKQAEALLQDTQLSPNKEMEKRCERWVKINNMKALETLWEVAKQVSPKLLNIPKIELSIMQLYSKKDDCEGALKFWKQLVDANDYVSVDVDMEFYNLVNRCKYDLPDDLELKYRVK